MSRMFTTEYSNAVGKQWRRIIIFGHGFEHKEGFLRITAHEYFQ